MIRIHKKQQFLRMNENRRNERDDGMTQTMSVKKSSTNICLKIDLRFKSEHDDEILIQFRFHSDFRFRKHEINVKIIIYWPAYRFYFIEIKDERRKMKQTFKKKSTTTTTATVQMTIQ